MTDLTPSSDDARDELVSAVLDGEADAAARAQVAADPALAARLEEMRAVRDLVAAPVTPLDELTAQRMRRAALDEALGAPAVVAATTPPRTHRSIPPVARWVLSAAAVVLLIVLAIPVLGSIDAGDDDETGDVASAPTAADMDEAAESSGADASGESDAGGERSADDAFGATEDGGLVRSLGAFATDADLADAALETWRLDELQALDDGTTEESEATPSEPPTAIASACPTPDDDVVVLVGEVDGVARIVHLVTDDGDDRVAQILAPETCAVVFTSR